MFCYSTISLTHFRLFFLSLLPLWFFIHQMNSHIIYITMSDKNTSLWHKNSCYYIFWRNNIYIFQSDQNSVIWIFVVAILILHISVCFVFTTNLVKQKIINLDWEKSEDQIKTSLKRNQVKLRWQQVLWVDWLMDIDLVLSTIWGLMHD